MIVINSMVVGMTIVVASILLISALLIFQSNPYPKNEFSILYNQYKTCEVAKQLAVKDFKHAKFNVVYWGLESYPTGREIILQHNFKIKLIHGGCMPISAVDCYRKKMFELLYKKYGNPLFPL